MSASACTYSMPGFSFKTFVFTSLLFFVTNALHFIFRPHCSTTYVDVAMCFRPSSVVAWSVCLSVTLVSPAKPDELIKMPFWLRTQVGPRNHVLTKSMYYVGCTSTTWRIPLNCPFATAMQPVIKLL